MYPIGKGYNKKMAVVLSTLRRYKIINRFDKVIAKKVQSIQKSNLSTTYKIFEDKHEALNWGMQYFRNWGNNLTKDEYEAIQNYTGCSAGGVNTNLRNLYKRNKIVVNDYVDKLVTNINKAFRKTSIPENIITFRWMDYDAFLEYSDSYSILAKLEGKTLKDNSFISSTMICQELAGYRQEDQIVLLLIKVPKGTLGAFIGGISLNTFELEVLISNNYSLKIEKNLYFHGCNLILLCDLT